MKAIRLRQGMADLVNAWPLLSLTALAALMLLWRLGNGSLQYWDEAIYAQVAKEIVRSGNWLTLHWQSQPWFEKPPLLMWITALFYQCFGVNEFWSRAASAFSGIGLIVVTYLVGKRVYDSYAGLLAGLVLLSSKDFVTLARSGTTDIMLTLCVFVAAYAYLRLAVGGQRWWYVICLTCALAVLVKGAGGLVAPIVITLVLWLDRRLAALYRSKGFWLGVFLACVIVAPWHIMMVVQHGRAFLENYVGYHIIRRSMTTLEEHVGGYLFYIYNLPKFFFPWFCLVPFALALGLKDSMIARKQLRILLLMIFLIFGIYTLVRTKIYWYILPTYPALAILIASLVRQAGKSYRSFASDGLLTSGLLIGIFIVAWIKPLNLALIFGVAVPAFYFSKARQQSYQLAALVMFALFVVAGMSILRPLYSQGVAPEARLARIAGSTTPDNRESLIIFSVEGPAPQLWPAIPLFYSNRTIEAARTLEGLVALTHQQSARKIILRKQDLPLLAEEYAIDILADAGPFIYGRIHRRP
jgi:4-amino-4-deoxy-L-arabinose transferase-like glycosyltransferase